MKRTLKEAFNDEQFADKENELNARLDSAITKPNNRVITEICKELVQLYESNDSVDQKKLIAAYYTLITYLIAVAHGGYDKYYDEAIEYAKKAIATAEMITKENPDDYDTHLNLAKFYRLLGICFESKGKSLPASESYESALDSLHNLANPEYNLRIKDTRNLVIYDIIHYRRALKQRYKERCNIMLLKIAETSTFLSIEREQIRLIIKISQKNSNIQCIEVVNTCSGIDLAQFASSSVMLMYSKDEFGIRPYINHLNIPIEFLEASKGVDNIELSYAKNALFKQCDAVLALNHTAGLTKKDIMTVCTLAWTDLLCTRYNPWDLIRNSNIMVRNSSAVALSGHCQGTYISVLPTEVIAHILSFLNMRELHALGL